MTLVEYMAERGWRYYEEWVPGWTDEDGDHEGFLDRAVIKDAPLDDGRLVMQKVGLPQDNSDPASWELFLRLAETGLTRTVEACPSD